jgi:hypothetical protein
MDVGYPPIGVRNLTHAPQEMGEKGLLSTPEARENLYHHRMD